MRKLIIVACILMIGSIGMAQSTPDQKTETEKKEAIQSPKIKKLKKVDVTVIERTESDTVKEAPSETPATRQETHATKVEKSKIVKKQGVEARPNKSKVSEKKQFRSSK